MKSPGLTWEWHLGLHVKLLVWRIDGENGIPRVAVKCVDMWKNTGGEDGFLGCN